jgi:UDP-glucose 4-epimerase
MDERHPTWPETVYGGSKLAGEAYARAFHRTYGMDTVVVRPFNTYGPRSHFEGDSGEIIPRTVLRVLNGQRPLVFGDGLQTRDLMYVSDTAAALVAVAASAETIGETLNLGSGHETSILDLCRAIASAAGRPDLEPQHLDPRPGDVRRLLGDPTRVRELVGFEPGVSLETGIANVVDWFSRGDVAAMASRIVELNWVLSEASR